MRRENEQGNSSHENKIMRSRKPSFGGVPEEVALTAAEAGPTTRKTDVTTVHVNDGGGAEQPTNLLLL